MASGDVLSKFTAMNNDYQGSNPATPGGVGARTVMEFDQTTDEFGEFGDSMDSRYEGSGITVTCWCWTSATTGNAAIEAAIVRQNAGDNISDAFTAVNTSGAVAVPGVANQIFTITITFTDGADMDSVTKGDPFRIRINRDTGIGSNVAADLILDRTEISETVV